MLCSELSLDGPYGGVKKIEIGVRLPLTVLLPASLALRKSALLSEEAVCQIAFLGTLLATRGPYLRAARFGEC